MNGGRCGAVLTARCEWAAVVVALVVVALGGAVLVGWAVDSALLKSVARDWAPMQPNAALGFVLAGVSLAAAFRSRTHRAARVAQRVPAALLTVLGVLTLAQYVLAADFGIDRVLGFIQSEHPLRDPPKRMAAATAAGFALTGLALSLLDVARARVWQAAALAGGLIGVLVMLGYGYNVVALYGVHAFSSVALHTAVGLVLTNLGVFLARPERGMMSALTSDTAGGVVARRLLPFAFVAPPLIGWLRVAVERAGYFDFEFGVALLSVTYVVLFGTLVWRTAAVLRDSDERRAATERDRREQQAKLTGIIESAMDGVVMVDAGQRIVLFNAAAESIFGRSAASVLGRPLELLLPQRFRAQHPQHLHEFAASGTTSRRMSGAGAVTALRANGEEFPVEASISQLEIDGRRYFTVILRDVTERRRIESDLRIAATAFDAHVGILVSDADNVILRVNRTLCDETGFLPEDLVGQTPSILKSGRDDREFYAQMWDSIVRNGVWQGELWGRRKNGEVYPKWMSITAVKGDDGAVTHYVGTQTDITERKAAEERIKYFAFYDPLTHLPNRRLLIDRLHQALGSSMRDGRPRALLFIDLDNFKALNDTLGHDKGDLLLQLAAARLLASVREGDTVARLGGDDFVVMLENIGDSATDAATHAEAVGEKIQAVLAEPFVLDGRAHVSTSSVGVALFGNEPASVENLLQQADMAMYQAKSAGRNALRFFDPAMQAAVTFRATLEADLRTAVNERQFVLHYQAQIDEHGRLAGAEVLVRWQHPLQGLVFPNDFIPVCEEVGLILPLGEWVLEQACAQLAAWAGRGDARHLTLAVNVSARQIRRADFVERVLAIVERTGADPAKLKLELTESQLMGDVEQTIEKMTRLRAAGIGFALDDFGTGYSSLAYLKRLLLDKLKIDRSFVTDVLTDPNDAAIARTIVALAQSLGLTVIAEGVESEAQRVFLAGIGCHAYQGFLFSRPVPIGEFEQLLASVRFGVRGADVKTGS